MKLYQQRQHRQRAESQWSHRCISVTYLGSAASSARYTAEPYNGRIPHYVHVRSLGRDRASLYRNHPYGTGSHAAPKTRANSGRSSYYTRESWSGSVARDQTAPASFQFGHTPDFSEQTLTRTTHRTRPIPADAGPMLIRPFASTGASYSVWHSN